MRILNSGIQPNYNFSVTKFLRGIARSCEKDPTAAKNKDSWKFKSLFRREAEDIFPGQFFNEFYIIQVVIFRLKTRCG